MKIRELGYSELTIAELLGHSANSVTARYAHHVDHALAVAADEVSELIAMRLREGWLRALVQMINLSRGRSAGGEKNVR